MKKFLKSLLLVSAGMAVMPVVIRATGRTTKGYRDSRGAGMKGSVAEIRSMEINGIRQGMIIRGKDARNPVLLYLHGGPGAPEFPFACRMNTGLEEIFVVCYWDQRGAGLSYSSSVPAETMNMDWFIKDAIRVTEYLCTRFNTDKIYILGHSWGSYLGAMLARDYPHYYEAFISTGQMTNQIKSETRIYKRLLSMARERNDRPAIRDLEKIGPPPWYVSDGGVSKITKQRKLATRFRGTLKDSKNLAGIFTGLITCREYSLVDKINYARGVDFTLRQMLDTVMKADLFREVPEINIPVFFLQGLSDYHTEYQLAREYFEYLKAPYKEFHTFYYSAHAAIFEEPEKFNTIVQNIVSEHESRKELQETTINS